MTTPHARPVKIALGVGLVITAAFLISVQDVMIKRFDGVLPLWQFFALRGLFTAPLLAVSIFLFAKDHAALASIINGWALLRAACITIGLFGFYASLPFISLATAGAGIYLAPIFMTLLSARVLGEPVGRRGWLGVLLGFVGVLVLLRPGTEAFSLWAVLPVIGAAFYAAGHILTRVKCQNAPALSLAFTHNLGMTLGAAAISALLLLYPPTNAMADRFPFILGSWTAPSPTLWAMLALLGALFAAIGILLANAYKIAPPSTVGTFEYSYLIFAIVWDIAFFDIVPSLATLTGIVLIIAAGLLVLRRV